MVIAYQPLSMMSSRDIDIEMINVYMIITLSTNKDVDMSCEDVEDDSMLLEFTLENDHVCLHTRHP